MGLMETAGLPKDLTTPGELAAHGVIEKLGLKWEGLQETPEGLSQLVSFTDTEHGNETTFTRKLSDITEENVKVWLQVKRAQFKTTGYPAPAFLFQRGGNRQGGGSMKKR